jgi:hypothetical protein
MRRSLVIAMVAFVSGVAASSSAQTDCARPPRSLVQRFDEWDRDFRGGRGFKGQTNEERQLAWAGSRLTNAYLTMYEATGSVHYLRKLVGQFDAILAQTDQERNVFDYRGIAGPVWRKHVDPRGVESPEPLYGTYVVHSGQIVYPMARFAAIVKSSPKLRPAFGRKADEFMAAARAAIDHHESQWCEHESGRCPGLEPGEGMYRFPTTLPSIHPNFELAGDILPWNMQHSMGRAIIALAAALDADGQHAEAARYRDRAAKMARLFRRFLCTDDPWDENAPYIWEYQNYGFCESGCDRSCVGPNNGCPRTHNRDIGHARIDVDFMALAAAQGIEFTELDMKKLRATYLDNIVKGEGELHDTLDGRLECDSPDRESWRAGLYLGSLAPWDTEAEEVFFSAQSVYDRPRKRPHSDAPDLFNRGNLMKAFGRHSLSIANLAANEGAIKLYGIATEPGPWARWLDTTAADLDGDGVDLFVGLRADDLSIKGYAYDARPGTHSLDRVTKRFGLELTAEVTSVSAVTGADFDGDGRETLVVLGHTRATGKPAMYLFDQASSGEHLVFKGRVAIKARASAKWSAMEDGVFVRGSRQRYLAMLKSSTGSIKLKQLRFDDRGVVIDVVAIAGYDDDSSLAWRDLAVGDLDGAGLDEIIVVGASDIRVLRYDGTPELVEVLRTSVDSRSRLAAVTTADLNGDGIDEMLSACNDSGSVFRHQLRHETLELLDRGTPFGASSDWAGLCGGRFSQSTDDDFIVGLSNRTHDIYVYNIEDRCPYDLDCDGSVDLEDFAALIPLMGRSPERGGDFNGDGRVDVRDMLAFLTNMGACS